MAQTAALPIDFVEPNPAPAPLRLATARPVLKGNDLVVSKELWAIPPKDDRAAEPLNGTKARKNRVRAKGKGKKNARKGKSSIGVGSHRGIESMLRNTYRTQLAMIALAARKSNIMISVNGFLLSLLTLSSSYILTTEPLLLIPSGVFLTTCVVAIIFAVLAARPQGVDKARTSPSDFRSDRADLLVFEQFAHLSKADHMSAMLEMMNDQQRVYQNMVSHIYFLGKSASKRFALLKVSYNAFILGLMASFATLVVVAVAFYL